MADNATFEKQVLELTNAERAKAGLQPLKGNAELDYAADKYAEEMSERGVLSHTGPDGSQPWDRAKEAGYEAQYMGENIAAGQRTPEEVVQGWMNSPGHRANILNANYTELGVGFHNNYWGQLFGSGDTNPASNIPSPVSNSASQPTSDTNQGTDNSTLPNDTGSNNTLPDDKGTTVTGDQGSDDPLSGDKGTTVTGDQGSDDPLSGDKGTTVTGDQGSDDPLSGDKGTTVTGDQGSDDPLSGDKGTTVTGDQGSDDPLSGDKGTTVTGDQGSDDPLSGDKGTTVTGDTGSNDPLSGDKGTTMTGDKGTKANKELKGGDNSDVLTGGQGNDFLNGGAGNDRLTGGMGKDKMTGGPGSDRFVFNNIKDKGDIITDFDPSQDVIDMRGMMPGGGDRNSNKFSDRIKLEPVGGDTAVRLNMDGNGKSGGLENCMLLQNTNPSSLTANNFMF